MTVSWWLGKVCDRVKLSSPSEQKRIGGSVALEAMQVCWSEKEKTRDWLASKCSTPVERLVGPLRERGGARERGRDLSKSVSALGSRVRINMRSRISHPCPLSAVILKASVLASLSLTTAAKKNCLTRSGNNSSVTASKRNISRPGCVQVRAY